jgi:hypothetical protein
MTKTNIKKDIKEITKISRNIPSLMETIHFSPEREREMYEDEEEFNAEPEVDDIPNFDAEPEMDETPMPKSQDEMPTMQGGDSNVEGFIANMRKESLGIMKSLADNPDDAVYQFAKKIFQLADKAHEDQKEGKDINGEVKQGADNKMK